MIIFKHSKMAPSFGLFHHWHLLLVLLLSIFTYSNSDGGPSEMIGQAVQCFSNNAYSRCQDSYRLGNDGNIDVPPQGTEEFCNGPCLPEIELVLTCIDNLLNTYQFQNRASTRDIRERLRTGCGHGEGRGNFKVLEGSNRKWDWERGFFGGDEGENWFDDCDKGDRLDIPFTSFMAVMSCLLVVWVF